MVRSKTIASESPRDRRSRRRGDRRATAAKPRQPKDRSSWTVIYVLRGALALLAMIVVLAVWIVSRIDRSEIRSYTIPKKDRMLAAIVPRESQAWVFKLLGPERVVAEKQHDFRGLIESLRFDPQTGQPTWTLPRGWRRLPADAPQNEGMVPRFATLLVPISGQTPHDTSEALVKNVVEAVGDVSPPAETLEVSVTVLPLPESDRDKYLLDNVNRWRGQMQLAPITAAQLGQKAEQRSVAGTTATLVNLAGNSSQRDMMASSVGSPDTGLPPDHPPVAADTRAGEPANPTFEVPGGWHPSAGNQFSRFAFVVMNDKRQVDITVSPMSAARLLDNVNRWRRQLGLGPWTQAEMDGQIERIELGEITGDYVALDGASETILAVVAAHRGTAWVVRLRGDRDLAHAQQEQFESFVKSFRFPVDEKE